MGTAYHTSDAPFGFQPWDCVLRARYYAVQTNPTIHICIGDMVRHGGTAVSTPYGYKPIVDDDAVIATSEEDILGAVLACFDENMYPINHINVARTGNSTIAGYILVADHPDQLFIGQEDGDSNAIDLDEVGLYADLAPTALNEPDSNTYLSTMQIDSTSATNGAAHLALIEPHEDDTPGNDTYPYARWIVKIYQHYYASANADGA